jgi:hypothetical protein
VLKVIPNPEDKMYRAEVIDEANPLFVIVGFGKTSVTATVGDWSDHKDFAVVEVPIKIPSDTSVHDWIKQFGFPVRKFWTGQARSGFDPIPAGCCGCGFVDGGVWVDDGTRERRGGTEYWEYAAWPRCLFGISDDLIRQVATRPAITSTATAPASSPRKQLTKAQEDQIHLRLQSLYAALYSLPNPVPVDQFANVSQQRANLTDEISRLEAQLADPDEPKGK